MYSSSTVFHALRKSRLKGGETVAIFGVGGLGISAVQPAQVFGALNVYAVDINADKYLTKRRGKSRPRSRDGMKAPLPAGREYYSYIEYSMKVYTAMRQ